MTSSEDRPLVDRPLRLNRFLRSTMQDYSLTISAILRHAIAVHGDRTVTTATGDGYRHSTYREVGSQAARLANVLRAAGVEGDDRVATFCVEQPEHLEAYVAVPSMGRSCTPSTFGSFRTKSNSSPTRRTIG